MKETSKTEQETAKAPQPTAAEEFGERLKQERREKAARDRCDLGQIDIAEAIGSSGPSVSRWEAGLGIPGERMISALAAYFGVTPAWLRYGTEPRRLEPEHPPTLAKNFGVALTPPYSVEAQRVVGVRSQGKRGRDR